MTGFGVLGHLVEMVNAQEEDENTPKTTAKLYLGSLPCMLGAVDCIEQGIFSSLQPQNIRLRRAVRTVSQKTCSTSFKYPLLFDPQTAGGLLATVPRENAARCMEELVAMGYEDTCVVGEIVLERDQPANDRGIEIVLGKYGEENEEENGGGESGPGGENNEGRGGRLRRRNNKQ